MISSLHHTWLVSPNDTQLTLVIRMLETGFFADCTVTSKDQTWSTHKVILSRCPYFACAFSTRNGFKVRSGQKKSTKVPEKFQANFESSVFC